MPQAQVSISMWRSTVKSHGFTRLWSKKDAVSLSWDLLPNVLHQCHPIQRSVSRIVINPATWEWKQTAITRDIRTIEVLAALLPRQQAMRGGMIVSSLRLAVGGVVQRFSSVGCSALWEIQKVVCWFSGLPWWGGNAADLSRSVITQSPERKIYMDGFNEGQVTNLFKGLGFLFVFKCPN